MSIIWKYINKNVIAIEAIRDYGSMKAIINNTPDEIKEQYLKTLSPSPVSSKLSDMPKHHDPQAGENILLTTRIDVLKERYTQALEFIQWFEPAWSILDDMEKDILSEFYMHSCQRSGAACRLVSKLNYSERQIHRIRERVLNRLRPFCSENKVGSLMASYFSLSVLF